MQEYMNEAVFSVKASLIREFSALAAATPGAVGLTLGEPDFHTPDPIIEAAEKSMEAGDTHYIPNRGSAALIKKISEYEKEKHGLPYAENEIIVTAGATEALFTAFFGILNPDDEVIIPVPFFGLYEEVVKLSRGRVVQMPLHPGTFQIDKDVLNNTITEKTKAIILNSPNNPTGCMLNKESLDLIYEAVKGKPIFVVTDDVYRELVYEGEYHTFAEYQDIRKQIIMVQSFSKPYAMTGWRMGYLCADREIVERLEKVHQYILTSTPAMFQKACMTALETDVTPFREQYMKRREYMLKRLEEIGLPVVKPEGAFYVFPSIEKYTKGLGISGYDFCVRMLQEEKLAVTPGEAFGNGMENFVRMTYCYSDEELKTGMDRLASFIAKLDQELESR